MRILDLPLTDDAIGSLEIGDTVYLTGEIVTGRDEAHLRALEYLSEGKEVPKELYGSVIFHCGPILQRDGDRWRCIAAGPTTSARMNSTQADVIDRFGIKAIVGKGGMSKGVLERMKGKCVYLAATGGAAVFFADAICDVSGVEWLDLGMAEAIWRLKVEMFGPLVVAMDSKGNSLYDNVMDSLVRDHSS